MRIAKARMRLGAILLAASVPMAAPALAQDAAPAPVTIPQPLAGVYENPCTPGAGSQDPRLRDFAALCRYRADDAALLAANTPVRTVFMGDSITEGWLNGDPSLFTNGTIDRGISGQTTPQMLLRFRQDVIALHPAVVHIMAGTNDIAGNTGPATLDSILGNITSMGELAEAHHIRVVIASVLPVYSYPWQPDLRPAATIRTLNALLRGLTRAHHWGYVDYYAALTNEQGGIDAVYAGDGVHPSPAGYQLMRPLTMAAINQSLGRKTHHGK